MGTFSKKHLKNIMFHPSTTWFLSQCSEARGMQEMWNKVRPEVLKKLKESAIIQSSESSNRIEGVTVDKDRLIPLVVGTVRPKDRPEEEIYGYTKALDFIHENFNKIKITPKTIQKLHKLAQGGMIGDAGAWKKKNNDIIEIDLKGDRSIRFRPVSAAKTPKAIEQLCLGYNDVIQNSTIPDLIAVSNFILDFLCIHPFRDGNGRVSRLLTLLLLYQNGYEVGKYISLERIVEETKDDYYKTLKESSIGWHNEDFNLMPWWNYFLSTIKSGYQELRDRVDLFKGSDNQSSLIRETIITMETEFTISDIMKIHPSVDREIIKKVLSKLKEENRILLTGRGRAAKWKKL